MQTSKDKCLISWCCVTATPYIRQHCINKKTPSGEIKKNMYAMEALLAIQTIEGQSERRNVSYTLSIAGLSFCIANNNDLSPFHKKFSRWRPFLLCSHLEGIKIGRARRRKNEEGIKKKCLGWSEINATYTQNIYVYIFELQRHIGQRQQQQQRLYERRHET